MTCSTIAQLLESSFAPVLFFVVVVKVVAADVDVAVVVVIVVGLVVVASAAAVWQTQFVVWKTNPLCEKSKFNY